MLVSDLLKKSATRVVFFKTSTRPSKQPREHLQNTLTITINSPSTSYSNNQDKQHGFNSSGNHNKKAEYLALKLDRLRDKVENAKRNIRDRPLRQRKQKKFHQLKFKPRQPQKYDLAEKEDTPTEILISKSSNERSYVSALRRGNSKTDLQRKRSNKNLKQTLSKSNFVDKNQASIAQQLDIRTNEESHCNNLATSSIKETITTDARLNARSSKTAYPRDDKTES